MNYFDFVVFFQINILYIPFFSLANIFLFDKIYTFFLMLFSDVVIVNLRKKKREFAIRVLKSVKVFFSILPLKHVKRNKK